VRGTAPPPTALLALALDHACAALGRVAARDLDRPTPCAAWDLGALLAHLDDALDAFTEAAGGAVPVHADVPLEVRVGSLRRKAYGLLSAWSGAPATVRVGGVAVEADVVVRAAALEVAVHGWDVDQATGAGTPLPDALARGLLPLAAGLVGTDDRPARFAPPHPPSACAGPGEVLLGFLGRSASRRRGPTLRAG